MGYASVRVARVAVNAAKSDPVIAAPRTQANVDTETAVANLKNNAAQLQ